MDLIHKITFENHQITDSVVHPNLVFDGQVDLSFYPYKIAAEVVGAAEDVVAATKFTLLFSLVDEERGAPFLNSSHHTTALFLISEIVGGIYEVSQKTGFGFLKISCDASGNAISIELTSVENMGRRKWLSSLIVVVKAVQFLFFSRGLKLQSLDMITGDRTALSEERKLLPLLIGA